MNESKKGRNKVKKPVKVTLVDVLRNSPLVGLNLDLLRQQDFPSEDWVKEFKEFPAENNTDDTIKQ